ncbi:acyl-CoA N-acyltransferase [Macrolepiota fuliginosa MF-IS2]|uniref:Acyl-CoA N-acyltransferase n=1 Tax=Macrolepiota fuliginosa MF-IS2 TaxID=1400762 RepID=A0A9P5XDW9_9AGAR|nr:acyl-CoA N-acyltransferase [Macrolepiota fuliginosa MF-IS2]
MTNVFDQNFCFPVPAVLENPRLKLIPWDPSLHSNIYVQSIAPHPELFDYLPFGPFNSRKTFDPWFEERIHKQRGQIAFAIFDKTQGDSDKGFAGMIGLLNASSSHLSTEIGFVTILPAFQRSHVASNAVGLLLNWALNPPGPVPVDFALMGLGLRRVYWNANTLNTRSIALAERLGLKLEAVLRWDRVLPADRVAFARKDALRKDDPREGQPGRDTALLAICWDDWVNGGREKAVHVMERVS